MKQMIRIVSALLILTLAVVTVYAGGWNDTAKPTISNISTEIDEVDKIMEGFMEDKDFDKEFFAKKADMTIDQFEEFLKKPVTGSKEVSESEIQAVGCMRCMSGKYIEVDRSCSSWSSTGNQQICKHKNFGVDLEYVRHCYSVKKCDRCGFQISGSWDENKWECHGFNDGSLR